VVVEIFPSRSDVIARLSPTGRETSTRTRSLEPLHPHSVPGDPITAVLAASLAPAVPSPERHVTLWLVSARRSDSGFNQGRPEATYYE
jgi:hypothetical protein